MLENMTSKQLKDFDDAASGYLDTSNPDIMKLVIALEKSVLENMTSKQLKDFDDAASGYLDTSQLPVGVAE